MLPSRGPQAPIRNAVVKCSSCPPFFRALCRNTSGSSLPCKVRPPRNHSLWVARRLDADESPANELKNLKGAGEAVFGVYIVDVDTKKLARMCRARVRWIPFLEENMSETETSTVLSILRERFDAILDGWISTQSDEGVQRTDLFSHKEGREQTSSLLRAMITGIAEGDTGSRFDLSSEPWTELRTVLVDVTQERSARGVSPSDMASFVLALKGPIFFQLKELLADQAGELVEEIFFISRVIDAFAVYCTEVFIAERDRIIEQQRDQMQELSTPVVELWDKVLTLPLIGTMDSARAQEVMENLLETILQRQSEVVIVDLTGVQTVDTQVAQHMLRMASAVRLMGAECIISGISPTIAQTMVQLGVDVGEVTTRSTIRTGLADALNRVGYEIVHKAKQ